jgi:hypothetical protein
VEIGRTTPVCSTAVRAVTAVVELLAVISRTTVRFGPPFLLSLADRVITPFVHVVVPAKPDAAGTALKVHVEAPVTVATNVTVPPFTASDLGDATMAMVISPLDVTAPTVVCSPTNTRSDAPNRKAITTARIGWLEGSRSALRGVTKDLFSVAKETFGSSSFARPNQYNVL